MITPITSIRIPTHLKDKIKKNESNLSKFVIEAIKEKLFNE